MSSFWDSVLPPNNSNANPAPVPAVSPKTPTPTTPTAKSTTQAPAPQPQASKGFWDDVLPPTPKAPITPTPLNKPFAAVDKIGNSFGFSDEKDVSGKPFFAYRKPGDTATTTDKTRVATNFDPRVPQKLDSSMLQNGRLPESMSSSIKKELGGNYSQELDHQISLELAGSNDRSNLKLEANVPGTRNTATDPLENSLARQVKEGKISLFGAHTQLANNKGMKAPFTGTTGQTPSVPSPFWDKMGSAAPQEDKVVAPPNVKPGESFTASDGKRYVVQSPTVQDIADALYKGMNGDKLNLSAVPADGTTKTTTPIQTKTGTLSDLNKLDQGIIHLIKPIGAVYDALDKGSTQPLKDYVHWLNDRYNFKITNTYKTDSTGKVLTDPKTGKPQIDDAKAKKELSKLVFLVAGFAAPDLEGVGANAAAEYKSQELLKAIKNLPDELPAGGESFAQDAEDLPKMLYHGADAETAAKIKDGGFVGSEQFPGTGMVSLTESPDIAKGYAGPDGQILEVSHSAKNIETYSDMSAYDDALEAAPGKGAAEKEMNLNKDVDMVRIENGDGKGNPLVLVKPDLVKPNPVSPTLPSSITAPNNSISEAAKDGGGVVPYKDDGDLSTSILSKLDGRTTVSSQYISDLSKAAAVKGPERSIIQQIIKEYPIGKPIPVADFAKKVKAELVPLERTNAGTKNGLEPRYERTSLPDDLKGKVANYSEHVYQSPVKTSAGNTHFGGRGLDNYFGHTRIEDVPGNTRRVIEVQSDLYQKGNLARESAQAKEIIGIQNGQITQGAPEMVADETSKFIRKEAEQRLKDVSKLDQYNDPTAHFRMVREEIKQAAKDGKTKLQFPTGETAMKIEGLGATNNWLYNGHQGDVMGGDKVTPETLKTGQEIYERGNGSLQPWIVTKLLDGPGLFQAVPKDVLIDDKKEDIQRVIPNSTIMTVNVGGKDLHYSLGKQESFDISGKVDTNNPIYKFYEKEMGKYLKNNFSAERILDNQGVSWYQVPVSKDMATKPVPAFKYKSIGTGPKANVDGVRKLIKDTAAKYLPGTNIKLVFDSNLLKENGALGYFNHYQDVITGELKPLIALYEKGGKVPVRAAFHEVWHALEDAMPSEQLQQYRNDTLKVMTEKDKEYYRTRGYKGDNAIASEYMADEWGKEQADKAGYKSPIQSILDKINAFIQKIIDTAKAVYKHVQSIPNRQGGFAKNPFAGAGEEAGGPMEKHLSELKVERDALKDSLDNNPAKNLVRFVNHKTGELPQALGTGRSKFGMVGDELAADLGFKSSEEARLAYQNYALLQKRFKLLTKDIKNLKKVIQNAKLEDKDAKSLKAILNKTADMSEKDVARIASANNKPSPIQAKLAERQQIAQKNLDDLLEATYRSTPPLERESTARISQITQEAYNITLAEHDKLGEEFSLPNISIDTNTPVKYKVGILDYFRTPDRVLQKIGLGGTARAIRKAYENYLGELPLHIDVIRDWKSRVSPESNERIFNYLDGQTNRDYFAGKKVTPLNKEEMRVAKEIRGYLQEWAERLGLPKDNQISHYITHIFNIGENEKEFDEDLAKIIDKKIPGSVYDPFLEKRLGKKGYIKDTWKALDAYVKRAVRKANMDPVLEKMKTAANRMELSQVNYLKRYADRINLRPTEIDNLVDNTIKQFVGYKFGQRPVAYLSRIARQMVYRATLGLNIGSAIKNLTQAVNTYAVLGEKYTLIGYSKLITQMGSNELEEQGILGQDMIQDKVLSASGKIIEKVDKTLFALFETAEKINRGAAYWGAKAKFMDEYTRNLNGSTVYSTKTQQEINQMASDFAKKLVRDTQFVFGSIDLPVGMSSDIMKLATQFMSFGVKQVEFAAEMVKNKNLAGILRYIVASIATVYLAGKAFNIKWTDFVPGYSISSRIGALPPTLAIPSEILKAVFNQPDTFGNVPTVSGKLKNIGNAAISSVVPGGVQGQKTYRGISAYNDPKKGIERTPYNATKAALLGPSNLSTLQEKFQPVFDGIQAMIKNGQTDEAQAKVNALSDKDYALYKRMKATQTRNATKENKAKMAPVVQKIQDLIDAGKEDEAQALVDKMTDEEYKAYKLDKKAAGIK